MIRFHAAVRLLQSTVFMRPFVNGNRSLLHGFDPDYFLCPGNLTR